MKRKIFILLFVALISYPIIVKSQMVEFGMRYQTDFRSNGFPIHNFDFGPQLGVTIPMLGFGFSLSAMLTMRHLDPREDGYFPSLYDFATIPIEFQYKIGLGAVKIVLLSGPYAQFAISERLKEESNIDDALHSSIWGFGGQIGLQFLNKYRISVGFKGDIFNWDLNDFLHHSKCFYLDLFVRF